MQKSSCAECLDAMAEVRGELFTRIACANCQLAEQDRAETAKMLHEISSKRAFVLRCSQCGRWCWTKKSLASHTLLHRTWENT
jgi:predicted nucleic-acid-binding Zn-ribbon protein